MSGEVHPRDFFSARLYFKSRRRDTRFRVSINNLNWGPRIHAKTTTGERAQEHYENGYAYSIREKILHYEYMEAVHKKFRVDFD